MSSKAIFVLVGGEAKVSQGCPHAEREFLHTSLPFVGSAYHKLRNAGVGRDRIITIVQLLDYLEDTLGALAKGEPKDSHMLRYIAEQRARTEASCALLLKEGGADYDHTDVNPATVLNVLTGRRFRSSATGTEGKVVPADHAGPIFIGIYSHGDSHSVQGPAGSTAAHSPTNAEWYAHMPYDAAPGQEHLLDFVAAEGAGRDRQGRPQAPANLYNTQLRVAFHELFGRAPQRPVVGLLNYCRSGGNLDFMRRDASRAVLGLDAWPLYLMSSSDAATDSLVGGLWDAWFSALADSALTPGTLSSLALSSGAGTSGAGTSGAGTSGARTFSSSDSDGGGGGGATTLEGLFREAVGRYRSSNLYELLNAVKTRVYSPKVYCLEFSWPGCAPGDKDPWHLDLKRCLDGAPWDPATEEPSKEALASLEEAYRSGKAFRLVPKGAAREAAQAAGLLSFGVAEVTAGRHAGAAVLWMGRRDGAATLTTTASLATTSAATEVTATAATVTEAGPGNWATEPPPPGSLPFPTPLTAIKGPGAGRQADLVAEVQLALASVAKPERVFGAASRVEALSVASLFL